MLGALEGDPERFAALRRPFEAMIDTQLHYARTVRGARQRHAIFRARHPRRPRTPRAAARARQRRRLPARRGERLAGARGSRPPRRDRALGRAARAHAARRSRRSSRRAGRWRPPIPDHIRIPRERLAAGESWDVFRARWAAWTRADDVICAWGRYPVDLLEAEGVALPAARIDVRPAAGVVPGRAHRLRRGLHGAPGRRRPGRVRARPRRRAPGGALGDRRSHDGRRVAAPLARFHLGGGGGRGPPRPSEQGSESSAATTDAADSPQAEEVPVPRRARVEPRLRCAEIRAE